MGLGWVKVGKQCVCTSDFWDHCGIDGPSRNEILTISEIYINLVGFLNLRFSEYHGWDDGDGGVHGYNVKNFRPITLQEQDLEQFKHLLNPTPLERLDRLAELLDLGY